MADELDKDLYRGEGSRPVPDPTLLTTQQLQQAISALKDLVFTRLDAMDKALDIFMADLKRVPTDVDQQVAALKELIYGRFEQDRERFRSIENQFCQHDKQTQHAAEEAKSAVLAALEAADKAVTKSEVSTLKLIDQLGSQIRSLADGLDAQISDIKGRLIRLEEVRLGSQTGFTNTVGLVGLIIGAVVGIGGIVLAVTANNEPAVSASPPIIIERQVDLAPSGNRVVIEPAESQP